MTGRGLGVELRQAIRDFGSVVGLQLGSANLIGSLQKLEMALTRASEIDVPTIARLSATALKALTARETVNGSSWERAHPHEFQVRTEKTANSLQALYSALEKSNV